MTGNWPVHDLRGSDGSRRWAKRAEDVRREGRSGTIQKSCSGHARGFQSGPPAATFTEGRVRVGLKPKRGPQRQVFVDGVLHRTATPYR